MVVETYIKPEVQNMRLNMFASLLRLLYHTHRCQVLPDSTRSMVLHVQDDASAPYPAMPPLPFFHKHITDTRQSSPLVCRHTSSLRPRPTSPSSSLAALPWSPSRGPRGNSTSCLQSTPYLVIYLACVLVLPRGYLPNVQ